MRFGLRRMFIFKFRRNFVGRRESGDVTSGIQTSSENGPFCMRHDRVRDLKSAITMMSPRRRDLKRSKAAGLLRAVVCRRVEHSYLRVQEPLCCSSFASLHSCAGAHYFLPLFFRQTRDGFASLDPQVKPVNPCDSSLRVCILVSTCFCKRVLQPVFTQAQTHPPTCSPLRVPDTYSRALTTRST